MLPLALLVLACASGIRSMYEAERDAALAQPPDPGESWQPEVRVRISDDALDGLVQSALDQGLLSWKESLELTGPLGFKAELKPQAELSALSLGASDQCDGCLDADATLQGEARWSAAGASGTVPFTAKVGATVAFTVAQAGSAWAVSGALKDVDRVKVGSATVGSLDATSLLGDWVSDALKQARPMELGTFGGAELPLRAARLSTPQGQLELQLLTDVPDGGAVAAGGGLSSDFEVRVSTATALALARRKAFEIGPIEYDVAAIPTSLSAEGASFTMGLRLWKIEGVGWWRDYSVVGQVGVQRRSIKLTPTQAVEGEKSSGAGLADPLALLAEGQILEAVEGGMNQTLPASTGVTIGKRTVTAQVEAVTGASAALVLTGSLKHGPTQVKQGEGRTLSR